MPGNVPTYQGPFIAPIRTAPSGQVQTFEHAAGVFQQLAEGANRRQNQETAALARSEAARLVAETGKPVKSPQGGLYGEAFNASMRDAYSNVVELRLREKAFEASQKHPNDPAALNAEIESWATGFRKELPPDFKTNFDLMRQRLSQPLISQARGNAFQIAQDSAEANLIALRTNIYRHIDVVSPSLFSGDPLQTQQAFDAIALEWETLEKHYNQRGPTGAPLFSEKDKIEKRIEFFDRVYESGLRGWVDAHPNKIKAYKDLLSGNVSFELGELDEAGNVTDTKLTINPATQMTREQRDKVLSYSQSQMNAYISAQNRVEQDAKDALKKRQDLTANEAARRMVDKDPARPFTREWVDSVRDHLDPSDYQAYIKATGAGPELSDPDSILLIEDQMEFGRDAWSDIRREWVNGNLTKQDFFSLRSRNSSFVQDRSPQNPYKRAIEYIETSFGMRSPMDKWTPIQAIGAQARVDFDRWWDSETREGKTPSFEAAYEQAQRLLINRLPAHKLKTYMDSFIPKPDRRYTVFSQSDPTVIDAQATAAKIFSEFGVDPRSDNLVWPSGLVEQLQRLDEYQSGYDRFLELKGAQDATERTLKQSSTR